MQLSKRLLAVSDMVTSGNRLTDVGTDHAYIPIYLCKNQRISEAIAMDINEGPLIRARENIKNYQMENKISTRLSDGAAALKTGETDSVVIAGMGGGLMIRILTEGEQVLKSVSELILQPQSDIEQVRRFLQLNEYQITYENMILEDGKYYPMMHVKHGKMASLTDIEYKYGPWLLEKKHPCLKQFLDKEDKLYTELANNLRNSRSEKAGQRILEVEKELQQIHEAKERYT